MTPRLVVQLEVGFFAGALAVVAVIGYLRSRRASYLVLMAQVLLVLEVGLVVYALNPVLAFTPWLDIAGGAIAVALLLMLWSLYQRRKLLAAEITVRQLDRFNRRGIVNRLLMILCFTALLFNFEPWLGVANVVLNVVLAAVFVAPSSRRYAMTSEAAINAPATLVFDYLVDTSKWSLYRRDGEGQVTRVDPPGRLQLGSKIVARQRVPTGRKSQPFILITTNEVTALEPDRLLETVWVERPSERGRFELETLAEGVRIRFRLFGQLMRRDALAGLRLDLRSLVTLRQTEIQRNHARLKQILEGVPAQ